MAFRGRKVFGTFEKLAPGTENVPSNIAGLGKINKVAAQE